jgi:putative inorganic carbon (HCO3(-)) transporter
MIDRNNISPLSRLTNRIEKFTERTFLDQKLNNWLGYTLCLLFACAIGYLMAEKTLIGLGVTGALLGLTIVLVCLLNTEAGLYINIFYAFFICHFNRMVLDNELQVGIFQDVLVYVTFLSFFVRKVNLKQSLNQFTRTSVVIMLLAVYGYMAIELFNPYAAFFVGWFPAFRKILSTLLILFISFNVFDSWAAIKRFISVLFVLCMVVAIYACIQQAHGFFEFEMDWLRMDPRRFRMAFVGGGIKKMSTMPDALSFSIIMATCSVFFIAIANGIKGARRKTILLGGAMLMLVAMSYAITRTANAMVVGGIALFVFLTLDKKVNRALAVLAIGIFLLMLYLPVYNPQLEQFRQTFKASNDPSYLVRENNRKSIQPYMYRHPIGAGLGTTGTEGLEYNPGHYLAGFPPDSGYLKKALEMGWLGFGMICILYFLILRTGVRGYFHSRDPKIRTLYAAATAACFAFYVGDFSQVAIGQITDVMVYYPLIALILKLKDFDQSTKTAIA